MNPKPYIQLRGVSKGWKTSGTPITILHDIHLNIHLNQSIAIVGPSGAGKSTLLHILGLLTPVDTGDFLFNNINLNNQKEWWNRSIRLNIGFIFQDAKLIPNLNVLENVAVPLLHRGLWPRTQKKLAKEALEKVGLSHRFGHNPSSLSGGELMRVAIARALVLKPQLILADEPTGTLDSKNGKIVADLLYSLVHKESALVMVTHHLPLAERADRVIEINDGLITER